eukprot:gene16386-18698_t
MAGMVVTLPEHPVVLKRLSSEVAGALQQAVGRLATILAWRELWEQVANAGVVMVRGAEEATSVEVVLTVQVAVALVTLPAESFLTALPQLQDMDWPPFHGLFLT